MAPEVCKSFVTLFNHMSTSPVPNSVIVLPVESSPSPEWSTVFFVLQADSFACI